MSTVNKAAYVLIDENAVAAMHQSFMDKIEEKAAAAVAQAETPKLKKKAVDFMLRMARLRVKDYATDKLAALLTRAANDNPSKVIGAELKKITRSVDRRESNASSYGAAEVPKGDMKVFEEIGHARQLDPRVKAVFGDKDRIYLDVPAGVTDLYVDIEHTLRRFPGPRAEDERGYTITDWNKGLAVDSTGKQTFKIGRLLRKHGYDDLQRSFERRDLDDLMIVLSCRVDDIVRASTNRRWGSCAGPRAAGEMTYAYERLSGGMAAGQMIAYLAKKSDPEVHDPVARVMVNPYNLYVPPVREKTNSDKIKAFFSRLARRPVPQEQVPSSIRKIWGLGAVYGDGSESFQKTVQAFLEDTINAGAYGSYTRSPKVYPDGHYELYRQAPAGAAR